MQNVLEQGPVRTFGVDLIKLSFRAIVFTQYMQRCFQSKYYYIHFSQIAQEDLHFSAFLYYQLHTENMAGGAN